MAFVDRDERLKQEEILKNLIKDTVDKICDRKDPKFENICRYGSRSEDDKQTVINKVFELMTSDTQPSSLEGAVSQVDSILDQWNE